MNDADRKFLTEAMGRGWNEKSPCKNRTFTTWDDFGAVWEWAKKQEWWGDLNSLWEVSGWSYKPGFVHEDIIDPIRFPEMVVDFLKEHKS